MKPNTARHVLVAAAAACAAASSYAQSSVTVYGLADMYMQVGKTNGARGATTYKVESGGESGSRLGFRGQEDLGGGLSAIFTLETGIGLDTGATTQGGVMWGRQSWVGLQSTTMGKLTAGRQYNFVYNAIDNADPFHLGLGSMFASGMLSTVGGSRLNNAVVYQSPKLGPITFGVEGALGEASTGRMFAANLRYASGPLALEGVYVQKDAFGNQVDAKSLLLGATYDFGFMKAYGLYQDAKDTTQARGVNDNRQEYFVGASFPFGPHTISALVGSAKTKDVSGSRASELSVGYQYALSKRTDLYVIGSAINNGSATSFTTSGGTGTGPTTFAGQDVRAMQVGIRHRF